MTYKFHPFTWFKDHLESNSDCHYNLIDEITLNYQSHDGGEVFLTNNNRFIMKLKKKELLKNIKDQDSLNTYIWAKLQEESDKAIKVKV